MIPVRLKIHNFTSYSDPPELDFTQFRLAAISGSNGAGKSSLLDAITWCLWGSSRAGDSADPLVHAGGNDMSVEFSFDLGGHQFSVKRLRNKKGGGSTSLELWSNSHNLTEGTIKSTQQKIIDTLHLSFETFTNSAFLRQGHADEFTTKGPTDRKRILADILGLSHYDQLEVKAKEKVKDIQAQLTLFDYQLLEIEAEISTKEEREQALSQIEEEGKALQGQLKEKEAEIKEIEEKRALIQKKIDSLKESQERYDNLRQELDDLKLQVDMKRAAQEEYKQIFSRKKEIEENYQKLQNLQDDKKELEANRSELIKIKDELVIIQKQLVERENKRTQAISNVELEIKELQTQIQEQQEKIDMLKNRKDVCPTCGQNIGLEKNKEIIAESEKLILVNQKKIQEKGELIKKYQSIVLPEEAQVKEKETAVSKLEGETKNYSKLSAEITDLSHYSDEYLKLSQAEVGIKTQQEAIMDLEKILQAKSKELEKSQAFEKDLEEHLETLRETEEVLQAQIQVKEDLSEKVLELRGKYGEAKQLVSRTIQLEELYKDKQKEKVKLTSDKEIYEELGLAFGKKGIQAMIIEQAIPEIEDETNRLLDKLTEGRMKVKFETQREAKTKESLIETLDIVISDEMGDRPYELFSGGEAFRVNFAIRLAISKLLTHRAGARLQFLVIDEGFGTQDAEGRTRLVEVIDAIKNDFEKILIITHLEELKEEFPTRIEVSKEAGGSTFEVVGS